ncbi:hypothetical protein BJY16_006535 [Actinoplanes octamycinicus]|uniref:Uncharacterized protein n=1 Tax=Actinoplanes octamycinicus TaxID=135948 RepID=A0A7W7H311_9ACTN|nr:hypothetical protein [Actinoplanes octamycinicus]
MDAIKAWHVMLLLPCTAVVVALGVTAVVLIVKARRR